MTTSTRPRHALLAVAASAALVLSGCGLAGGSVETDSPAPQHQTHTQPAVDQAAPSPVATSAGHNDDCEWDEDDREWDDCDDDRDDDQDDDHRDDDERDDDLTVDDHDDDDDLDD